MRYNLYLVVPGAESVLMAQFVELDAAMRIVAWYVTQKGLQVELVDTLTRTTSTHKQG